LFLIQIIGVNAFNLSSKLSAIACYCLSNSSSRISDRGIVSFVFVLIDYLFPTSDIRMIIFFFCVCAIVFVYFSISTSTLVWLLGKQLNIYRSTVERPRVHEHCRLKIIHTMRTTSEREREKRKNRREHSDRGARISLFFFFCSFSHFLFHRRSLVFSH
jgi:hypothetical protein